MSMTCLSADRKLAASVVVQHNWSLVGVVLFHMSSLMMMCYFLGRRLCFILHSGKRLSLGKSRLVSLFLCLAYSVWVCVCVCCPLPLFFKLYKISAKKSTRHISCCRKKIQEFVQSGSVLTLFCILCKKDPIKKENC